MIGNNTKDSCAVNDSIHGSMHILVLDSTIALLVERFVGEEAVEERQGCLGLVHWNLT